MFALRQRRRGQDVAEHVVPLDLGVEWQPNGPNAVLIASDYGPAVLALEPHFADADQRQVVLRWEPPRLTLSSPPNDEAITGHRLYSHGLSRVMWAGEVIGSALIQAMETQNRVHPRHDPARYAALSHHIVRTKEGVFEVVAESVTVERIEADTTLEAATRSIASR